MIWIKSDMTLRCVNIHFVVWLVAAALQVSLRWAISLSVMSLPCISEVSTTLPLKRFQIFNFIQQTTALACLFNQNCQQSIKIKLQLTVHCSRQVLTGQFTMASKSASSSADFLIEGQTDSVQLISIPPYSNSTRLSQHKINAWWAEDEGAYVYIASCY